MWKNYLKIALRKLWKHKSFSLLNISGLALGMACCFTLILIIRDQLSYDRFQPQAERVYRINAQMAEGARLASVPFPLGDVLLNDFSVCEAGVRLVRSLQHADATTAGNLTLPVSGFYTDPSFFNVFGFSLEHGNPATALSEPHSIILTKETAQRFFGDGNPIGETLALQGKGTYRITGVLAAPPGKSHLRFDCLASAASLHAIDQALTDEQAVEKITDNWENYFVSYLYVRVLPGKSQNDLTEALAAIAAGRQNAGQNDKGLQYFAQGLSSITPKSEQLINDFGRGLPWFLIWGMGAFVWILAIFPSLNYANLAISRALERAREVGIRKAVGARPADVKNMVLAEALLTAGCALVLAGYLSLLLNHFVAEYFPSELQLGPLRPQAIDWVIFAAFATFVGLLSGWLPARQMAGLHPARALLSKGRADQPRLSRFGWRTALMVGQFAVSLIFLIVMTTLWSQMRFMTLANHGFQKENLITVELQGNEAALIAAEMARHPRVLGVCAASMPLAGHTLQRMDIQQMPGGEPQGIHSALVDENYLPVMNLELVAGSNFPSRSAGGVGQFIILNEKAVGHFQLGSPAEAVGHTLWLNDDTPAVVQGVVKDFNYRSLEYRIEPFALRLAPALDFNVLHARISPGDPAAAMTALGAIWNTIDLLHPFQAEFMEETIQHAYGHVVFIGGLIGFFTLMATLLACMGLLGMVIWTLSTQVKEIGIRKVMGASVAQVALTISQRFLWLLGISILVALPLGYLLSNLFLAHFAYRISPDIPLALGCTALLLAIGLFTIGVQSIRAALVNPAESLRKE